MKKTIAALGLVSFLLGCGSNSKIEQKLEYTIIKFDDSGNQNTLKIQIKENYSKDQLIDISAELHKGFEDRKCVAYFYTNSTGEGTAIATSAYLPNCTDCATDKDKYGTPIQFKFNGNENTSTANP